MSKFSTSDLNLACTLMTLGYSFDGMDKAEVGRIQFIFTDKGDSIDSDVNGYWQRTLKVEPQAFALNFRSLKNMLHQ